MNLSERINSYIQTVSGKKIGFYSTDPDQICIKDIAHALAITPRFSGHTSRFYSVAAHSIMVSRMVPAQHKLQALLHDATEAYLTDMPTPFKRLLPDYTALEERLWRVIAKKFGVPEELALCVKMADRMCLMKEADELKPNRSSFGDGYEDYPRASHIYNETDQHHHSLMKERFLDEFKMAGGQT